MFVKPRLKQSYKVEVIEPDLVFLLSEHTQLVFEGRPYALLTPLLDGRHTLADVVRDVVGEVSPGEIYAALVDLERKGCLLEADGESALPYRAFWDYLDSNPATVAARLQDTGLSVRTVGNVDPEALQTALAKAGLTVRSDGGIVVVATDDYLHSDLDVVNRESLVTGSPWLLVKPVGAVVWVGPMFRPQETGCWKCLEHRLRVNRQVEHFIRSRLDREVSLTTSKARLPSTVQAAMLITAVELAKSIATDGRFGVVGKVLTLDLVSLEMREHVLVRRPQCQACGRGGPRAVEPAPIALRRVPKRPSVDLEQRTASVEEVYDRLRHHISPITGIVTSLTSTEHDDAGPTHNYVAGHYFPMTSDDMRVLLVNLFLRSGGKGATDVQARTSALCEALERYSGIAWGDEKKVRGSYRSLSADAIHVRDLALFSDEQYRNRENLEKISSQREEIPAELDDDAEIAWTPAWSLTNARFKLLPTAYCYYGFRDPTHFFTLCDSNGCASGNTLEEAILQGFLELVERDSVALWWYSRVKRPAVDADSLDLPYWNRMKLYYRRSLNREIHVLDITADLRIPTFGVISRRLDGHVEDIIVGFGAHFDPRIALLRALRESNQYLPALRENAEDGTTMYRLFDEATIHWWQHATLDNQPYLVPDAAVPPRCRSDFGNLATDDVSEDIRSCVRLAAARGLEVLVLDQTRPDIGLPVARVVVPGMRHFWRRLAPGRLYDVPVELGWLPRPLTESEMNPIACFV